MMRRKSKKIILLIGSIAAILSLTQCDLAKVSLSQALFPAKVIPFPIGEGKTVSYTVDSWGKKFYVIYLNIEYTDWNKAFLDTKGHEKIPYNVSIKCYHLKDGQEILFYESKHSDKTDERHWFDASNGWEPIHPHSPDASGMSLALKGFDLPYGKYRCDFKDESPSEIKANMKAAGIVATYLEISPYIALFR
ncbi:TPA: hypothetical protein ACFP30_002112 [Neisseria oralis]